MSKRVIFVSFPCRFVSFRAVLCHFYVVLCRFQNRKISPRHPIYDIHSKRAVEDGLCNVVDGLPCCAGAALCEDAEDNVAAGGSAEAGKGADVGDVAGFAVDIAAVRRLLKKSRNGPVIAGLGQGRDVAVGIRFPVYIAGTSRELDRKGDCFGSARCRNRG